jgi:DNA adenine methylase
MTKLDKRSAKKTNDNQGQLFGDVTELSRPKSAPKKPVRSKSMKPPFSYYGGKQRMASKIIPLLPQHTVYVEPFCGAATIMFQKPWPGVTDTNHYREVINDARLCIVEFFRVLRDPEKGPELCRRLELTPYSRYEFDQCGSLFESNDIIDRAMAWMIITQQSFSKIGTHWGTAKYGGNMATMWAGYCFALRRASQRMIGVTVEHDDALKVIERWDSSQTLFYCDPPYPNTDQRAFKGYTQDDFTALVTVLEGCQGNIVLSCYDNSVVPKKWERFEFKAKLWASHKKIDTNKDRTEVVWRRFNTTPVRPEIQKLYDSGKFDCYVPRPKDLPYAQT